MRVLVTGAAGFLGSHLTDRLLERGPHRSWRRQSVDGGSREPRPSRAVIRASGLRSGTSARASIRATVDYVFNWLRRPARRSICAWASKRCAWARWAWRTRWRLPRATTPAICTRRLRSVTATRSSIRRAESYWGNVNPVGPRSVYDEAKRFAEAMVMAYHRSRGVNTHLVRIFNTYGPRLHPGDGRVISNFMMQALRGEPLTIYGDGQQTRSFCYVDDLIEGIMRLSRSDEHLPVNIGNPEEFTILECAQAVLEVTGSKSKLCFVDLPVDDPTRRRPDITKARTLLGWEPRVAAQGRAAEIARVLQEQVAQLQRVRMSADTRLRRRKALVRRLVGLGAQQI